MSEDVFLELDDTCWEAVAVDGIYYVVVEWRRGEPCPTKMRTDKLVRAARAEFAARQQREPDLYMDGLTLRVSDKDDARWVAMFDRSRVG